jgi:hypothetical protein
MLLIEAVMGRQDSLKALSGLKADLMERKAKAQAALFSSLDKDTQKQILRKAAEREAELERPLAKNLLIVMQRYLEIPFLELVWACFAVAVPVCILLKKPWSLPAVWCLPAIAFFFTWHNLHQEPPVSDRGLFPREDMLLPTPLSGPLSDQRTHLEKAWKNYLITHWAKEMPSQDETEFENQAIRGEFFFNLERITYLPASPLVALKGRKPLGLLSVYTAWNLFFACLISLKVPKQSRASNPEECRKIS